MTAFLLHHLLGASASKAPNHTALVAGDARLTYPELDEASDRMASLLMDVGIRRGDRVGLYAAKSGHSVTAIYAASKVGAGLRPHPPGSPTQRAGYIADNCDVRVLVCDDMTASNVPALIDGGAQIDALLLPAGSTTTVPGVVVRRAVDGHTDLRPPSNITDDDLAYILYTSGSTGTEGGDAYSPQRAGLRRLGGRRVWRDQRGPAVQP